MLIDGTHVFSLPARWDYQPEQALYRLRDHTRLLSYNLFLPDLANCSTKAGSNTSQDVNSHRTELQNEAEAALSSKEVAWDPTAAFKVIMMHAINGIVINVIRMVGPSGILLASLLSPGRHTATRAAFCCHVFHPQHISPCRSLQAHAT